MFSECEWQETCCFRWNSLAFPLITNFPLKVCVFFRIPYCAQFCTNFAPFRFAAAALARNFEKSCFYPVWCDKKTMVVPKQQKKKLQWKVDAAMVNGHEWTGGSWSEWQCCGLRSTLLASRSRLSEGSFSSFQFLRGRFICHLQLCLRRLSAITKKNC
jgi:hypothetical protein